MKFKNDTELEFWMAAYLKAMDSEPFWSTRYALRVSRLAWARADHAVVELRQRSWL